MSVTQNYKKVTFSCEALTYAKGAAMARLLGDKERIESAKDSALIKFLRREIATGTMVLNALNAASAK